MRVAGRGEVSNEMIMSWGASESCFLFEMWLSGRMAV